MRVRVQEGANQSLPHTLKKGVQFACPVTPTSAMASARFGPMCNGPLALLAFVEEVFGAKENERHEFSSEKFHVEYRIGDSVLVIEAGPLPDDFEPWTSSVYMVAVEDSDAAFARALGFGASACYPLADQPYGERMGGVKDMAGNTWWISTCSCGRDPARKRRPAREGIWPTSHRDHREVIPA